MKYNTISTSSLAAEGKKATFTIYADMDISREKMTYSEKDMALVRGELEIVQRALKLQTKRCRQLVAEYTRRLQEKELQYQSEKSLRDDQLAKVLKALLIFEARLRQEQKFISSQLNEKDYIIKKQSNDIKRLIASQYCKNCNQYYTSSPQLESLDSSSEYAVVTDYQSSNFESMDSSSETYATISEKNYMKDGHEEKNEIKNSNMFQKGRNSKDSLGRRTKKVPHRKSIGTYFEVLKLRNESPLSNEDNTSADYDNLDSLPSESVIDKVSLHSESLTKSINNNNSCSESSQNISTSDCNHTVIDNVKKENQIDENKNENNSKIITENIPVFEGDNNDGNDNWYASASDQEDEERRDIYRNNPVLECMNQILLQNMNDSMCSPPKTPNAERKSLKNKKVKFSDENQTVQAESTPDNVAKTEIESNHNYYETPIQKPPNFYETPQSIYSNDYEQILSKCSETFSSSSEQNESKLSNKSSHHYVDMDTPPPPQIVEENGTTDNKIIRKSKILRAPPALPPKPPNLVSKYKIQNFGGRKTPSDKSSSEFEPDYCSISELNLPQNKNIASFKKINVVAEINAPTSHDIMNKLNAEKNEKKNDDYDPVIVNDNIPNMVVKKCVEKLNIQMAKQTPIKSELSLPSPVKKTEPDIPKLPQVSEIIIPEEEPKKEERITHDNYVKNNTQIMKSKSNVRENRKPVVMGSSVSSIINGFNNHQILSEIKKKHDNKSKVGGQFMFSSFENLQNLDKHNTSSNSEKNDSTVFDLSQNFEEFKLDECEIEEYNVEDELNEEEKVGIRQNDESKVEIKPAVSPSKPNYSTRVELIRATNDSLIPNLNKSSIELLKKQLELQKVQSHTGSSDKQLSPHKSKEPTYEHFLECTGLSTKSILTPSRLLSNHKSMLKPKDVKLRSKVKANTSLFERHSSGGAIKYWSEPYV